MKTNYTTQNAERKWNPLEEGSKSNFRGSTSLLVELEDQVARAAAKVQNAESEVRKKTEAELSLTGRINWL